MIVFKSAFNKYKALRTAWMYFVCQLKSTKFQAWVTATVLLCIGKITETAWVAVTGFYVGANIAQKFLKRKDNGKDNYTEGK